MKKFLGQYAQKEFYVLWKCNKSTGEGVETIDKIHKKD